MAYISFDAPSSDIRSARDLEWWMLDWIGKLKDAELAFGLVGIYHMWLARNDATDSGRIEHPVMIANRVHYLTEEWASLQKPSGSQTCRGSERWLPPPEGWIKANADGAFSQALNQGGGGVVLRDHHGRFTAGACCFFPLVTDPERAELLACQRALELAREMKVRKVILETDSMTVKGKLEAAELDRSAHGPLIENIKRALSDFADHSVIHVRRTGNEVAHKLAKVGCGNNVCNTWLGSPPDCCVSLLALDSAGF